MTVPGTWLRMTETIRSRRKSGESIKGLMEDYGMGRWLVRKILKSTQKWDRKLWQKYGVDPSIVMTPWRGQGDKERKKRRHDERNNAMDISA